MTKTEKKSSDAEKSSASSRKGKDLNSLSFPTVRKKPKSRSIKNKELVMNLKVIRCSEIETNNDLEPIVLITVQNCGGFFDILRG